MKVIKLTRGKVAIVNNSDFARLNKVKWSAHFDGCNWYARRRKPGPRSQNTTISMHQEILRCKKGHEVDHINGNGLDNRRSNLRSATHKQNTRNTDITLWTGVRKNGNKFVVRIGVNGQRIYLGIFPTIDQAHQVYLRAAKRYFGQFTRIKQKHE
jgi:hypothetical protein